MQIQTGKGYVTLMAVIAIWSLSLSVDLPGLAVTPMLNELSKIFPHSTQLEVQLITILPNLVIIPFVLLSGQLSKSNHKIAIIFWGVIIYIAAAILYFLFNSMTAMILVSCLLGIGCGLLLPFSTGLIADVFVGKYRMKQMGIISAVGNISVVVATYVVGWLAAVDWHLPFVVYLIPVVTLILLPFLKQLPKSDLYSEPATATVGASTAAATQPTAGPAKKEMQAHAIAAAPAPVTHKAAPVLNIPAVDSAGFSTKGQKVKGGFYLGRAFWLCVTYFFWVFTTEAPSYFMPYLMAEYGMTTQEVGTLTALFFLALFLMGLTVTPILKAFKTWTYVTTIIILAVGFLLFIFCKDIIWLGVAVVCLGVADGVCQPIIYDKATETCVSNKSATLALAILLSVNYLAIVLCPVLTDFVRDIFGVHSHDALFNRFPFILNLVLTGVMMFFVFVRRNGFTFGISKEYY